MRSPGEPLDASNAQLESAHEELCTALTMVRNEIELVRASARRLDRERALRSVEDHLAQASVGIDRLAALARRMREWRDPG